MALLMFCPRCTQSLPVTAGFCRRCGLTIRGATRPASTPSGGGLWKVGVGAVVGVLFLFVVGVIGLYLAFSPAPQPVTVYNAPYGSTSTTGINTPSIKVGPIDAAPIDGALRQTPHDHPAETKPGYPPSEQNGAGYATPSRDHDRR
jgi:hypothetical protein